MLGSSRMHWHFSQNVEAFVAFKVLQEKMFKKIVKVTYSKVSSVAQTVKFGL